MLCVSTTPGTRRAAAATRSLGASPPALGSTCTVTWAGPHRPDRVLDPVHGLVAALQALQPRHSDDDVGEVLASGLPDPHRTHLGHSRHLARRFLDQAAESRGGAVHQHVHVARGHPRRRHQHQRRHHQRGHRIAAGIAGGNQQQADDHRGGAGEVGAEVHALAIRAALCSWRPARSETVARPASTTSTPPISTNAYQCASHLTAAGAQPHHRLDRDPDREGHQAETATPTARPGAGPCHARTGAWRRAAARRRPPRTATAAPRPRRGRNARPRPGFRGWRWRGRPRASSTVSPSAASSEISAVRRAVDTGQNCRGGCFQSFPLRVPSGVRMSPSQEAESAEERSRNRFGC